MDQYNNMDKWVTEPEFVEEGDEAQRGGYSLHKDMKRCGKNDQHLNFIPFKFFLGKDSSAVFKIIEILGNLTVRISAFSKQRIKVNASGMLFSLIEIENLDYGRDHCLFFVIITAKHVISNDTDAKSATVEFFNDGDNRCDSNIARCIKLLASNNEGDFSEVLCMTTNRILATKIKDLLDFNHFKQLHRENLLSIFFYDSIRELKNLKTSLMDKCHVDTNDKISNIDAFTYPLRFYIRNIKQMSFNIFVFEEERFCLDLKDCRTEIKLLYRLFKNHQERKNVITLLENFFKFKCKKNNLYIHICYPYSKSKQVTVKLISTKSFIGPYMFMHNTPSCGGPVFVIPRECLQLKDKGRIQLDTICFLPHSKAYKEVQQLFSWRHYFDSSINNTLRLNSNQHSQVDNMLSDTEFHECFVQLGNIQIPDEECAELEGKFQNLYEDYEIVLKELNQLEELKELNQPKKCDEWKGSFTSIRSASDIWESVHYESKHSGVKLLSKVCTLLNIIEILGNLTVRVAVFSGTPNEVAACGMLFRIVEIENLDDQPGDDLYFTIVIPKHVISTEEDVQNAAVEFTNLDEDCNYEHQYASCVELLWSNNKSDFSEVVCKTNDKLLAVKIKNLFDSKGFKPAQKCEELKKPNSQYKNIKKLDKVLGKKDKFEVTKKYHKLLHQSIESTNSNAQLSKIFSRIFKLNRNPFNAKKLKYRIDAILQGLDKMEKKYALKVLEALESLFIHEGNDLCIHIGHPHGMSKQVTIGEIISTDTITGHYTFMYNTPTCPGCSGGPVFVVPRECLQLDDNGEIQFDKIIVLPHSNAYINEEKFSCNRSSSWMIYLDGSMNEPFRLSLPDETVEDIANLLKDALPSM